MKLHLSALLLLALWITACQPATQPAPTSAAQQATIVPSPTFTSAPTRTVPPTAALPATALPVTNAPAAQGGGEPLPASGLLDGGIGLTTGRLMSNGEFEVEGYCFLLNNRYGVDNDTNNWYCTQNGQRVVTLTGREFDDICRRTYDEPDAVARQDGTGNIPAFRWRCYDGDFGSNAPGVGLLDGGTGLTTGRIVNDGQFEVEGYCRLINQSFGVDHNQDNWFCTLDGERILTLSEREFSDICRRTYDDISAFALQNGDDPTPAFRWRCYGNQG